LSNQSGVKAVEYTGSAELNITSSVVTPSVEVGFFKVFLLVNINTGSDVGDSNPIMTLFDIVTGGKLVLVGIRVVDDGVPAIL